METIVWAVHLIAALCVIGLVLLQHGKGADMGAAFGSGTSGSLFGVSGASNLLSRTTAIMVTLFFCTSLGLTYFSGHRDRHSSVVRQVQQGKPLPSLPSLDKAKDQQPAPAKSKEVPQ
jgi:preprotein translocase subunit SecG